MRPHVCSWRMGFVLDNGFRGMIHDPDAILTAHLSPGQTAVDIGCGPGFFTIPMARQVGETGSAVAVDLQPRMLEKVRRKADRAGINGQLRLHRCEAHRIGLEIQADFVLAFYMVHEVPDPAAFFSEIRQMLKPGGRIMVVEPKFHVTARAFKGITNAARHAGLESLGVVRVAWSRGRLFARPAA